MISYSFSVTSFGKRHEVGLHEGRHFFVMDFVGGQSLARVDSHQPLPARRAAAYLKTVAEAVHYAHERGILHRDLKPSNVLNDSEDQPRVVDFGLAWRLEGDSELTATGQVLCQRIESWEHLRQ